MSDNILTDNPVGHAADIGLAKQIAEALHKHYPGHLWGVTCDGRTGMADILNLGLSGRVGFRMHIHRFSSSSAWERRAIMGAGELLERYKVRRGAIDQAQMASLPKDRAGNILGEVPR